MMYSNVFHSNNDLCGYIGMIYKTVWLNRGIPIYDKDTVVQMVAFKLVKLNRNINSSYIYATIRSVTIDYIRKLYQRTNVELNEYTQPELMSFDNHDKIDIKMLLRIPECVKLLDLLSRPITESAKKYGVTRQTIYNRKNKLIEKIKKLKRIK